MLKYITELLFPAKTPQSLSCPQCFSYLKVVVVIILVTIITTGNLQEILRIMMRG